MPLLQTPDLLVLGSTFRGDAGDDQQWFDRFFIASRGGLTLDISVRKSIVDLSPNVWPPSDVAILDLNFDCASCWQDVHGIDDGTMRARKLRSAVDGPHFEAVEIATEFIHFNVHSSLVLHSSLRHEQFAYDNTHMNLQVMGMLHDDAYVGILPELWGLRPLSDCTLALTNFPVKLSDPSCSSWSGYSPSPRSL